MLFAQVDLVGLLIFGGVALVYGAYHVGMIVYRPEIFREMEQRKYEERRQKNARLGYVGSRLLRVLFGRR